MWHGCHGEAEELALLDRALKGRGTDERDRRGAAGTWHGRNRPRVDRWRNGKHRVTRQRLYCGRSLEAMRAAMVGVEDNAVLGPTDRRIMELEPRHTEDDRIVAEARDVELDGLGMRADLELDGKSLVGDDAGRDGTSISHFEVPRLILEPETDGVALSERDINKRRGGAGVDQRGGCD